MGELSSFYHTLRVRYSEIDGQGIVFNSHYLTYCSLAMTEYFRAGGIPVAGEDEFDYVVVKATMEFRASARLDELLDIHVSAPKLGEKSFTFDFEVHPSEGETPGEPYLTAEIVCVAYDTGTNRAHPIPPVVRERLLAPAKLG